ncbi:MAG: ammonium transporter, partial [Myxococcales bacterium]|nr:ammonium transporter [Myxococcales bacterium]
AGIFGEGKSVVAQLYGIGVYAGFTLVVSALLFGLLKVTMGLRVSEEEELEGLDAGEHDMHAYDMGTGISARHHAPVHEAEPMPAE